MSCSLATNVLIGFEKYLESIDSYIVSSTELIRCEYLTLKKIRLEKNPHVSINRTMNTSVVPLKVDAIVEPTEAPREALRDVPIICTGDSKVSAVVYCLGS